MSAEGSNPEALELFPPPPGDGDWSRAFGHLTVLGPEAVADLAPRPSGVYVDGTLGGGGHSRLILAALGPEGRLIALDRDSEARHWAEAGWGRRERRLMVAAGSFGDLGEVLAGLDQGPVDGILLDLGISGRQLAAPGRGFSWLLDEPLDMRLDQSQPLTAREVVNRYPEKNLAEIIRLYGEERAARRLARAMVRARSRAPLETTGQLAALTARVLYRPGPPPRLHPATRTFQAIRLEVNRELQELENFLKTAPSLLKSNGRLVVISFHSLEDRLVKTAFRAGDEKGYPHWRPLTKKPKCPDAGEVERNPRARSAKMRSAVRLAVPEPGSQTSSRQKFRRI
ncbi:MAG: 16S rRNA (cytosine(1402)-N(4))-methyltransferase RsmH [Candidatus Adiutrix sp.]|nr:16S rRNA (cytosine(1402)-N(4))-methyltransferase RsmH [Candidatus Adiutrix sp.]